VAHLREGYIWSNDFGPVLSGYRLMNEDLSRGVEIEDCKLMPSRARQWWKPEPAWIKIAGDQPFAGLFKDANGDGKVGWWVYDFGPGFDFRITNSLALKRRGPQNLEPDQRGAQAQVSLPSATALTQVIIRDGAGKAQVLPCQYDAATRLAQFTVPAGLARAGGDRAQVGGGDQPGRHRAAGGDRDQGRRQGSARCGDRADVPA